MRERELNKDYIEQKIENERQFYEQLADEISSNPSYFTDDAPYDLEETPENREKGILKDDTYIDEPDDLGNHYKTFFNNENEDEK